jgi:hypothetical protein
MISCSEFRYNEPDDAKRRISQSKEPACWDSLIGRLSGLPQSNDAREPSLDKLFPSAHGSSP